MPGQRVDEHPGPADALGEIGVVQRQGRERDEQVQSRGDALHPCLRELRAEHGEQRVPPGALALADASDVPFELAGGDQARQYQLG